MNTISIILLTIVIGLFVVVAYRYHRNGSRKSCCRERGGCEGCSGCR